VPRNLSEKKTKSFGGKKVCAFKRCLEIFPKKTKSFGGKKVCAIKWSLEISLLAGKTFALLRVPGNLLKKKN